VTATTSAANMATTAASAATTTMAAATPTVLCNRRRRSAQRCRQNTRRYDEAPTVDAHDCLRNPTAASKAFGAL